MWSLTPFLFRKSNAPITEKLAIFDYDSTLVKAFTHDILHLDVYKLKSLKRTIVIVSNQSKLTTNNDTTFTEKMDTVFKKLGINPYVLISRGKDKFRKPSSEMFKYFVSYAKTKNVTIDISNSYYVGDAAGRVNYLFKDDFSDSDKRFAENCGLNFILPEDYFGVRGRIYVTNSSSLVKDAIKVNCNTGKYKSLSACTADEIFDNPQFQHLVDAYYCRVPMALILNKKQHPITGLVELNATTMKDYLITKCLLEAEYEPEMKRRETPPLTKTTNDYVVDPSVDCILLVGPPASGKSSLSKTFPNHLRVCCDELGTTDKCADRAWVLLQNGRKVVIDNTNPDAKSRAKFIEVAKELNKKIVCISMQTDWELCKLLNLYRVRKGGNHIPDIAYNIYKGNFQAPKKEEGFDEIYTHQFTSDFSDEDLKILREC